MQLAPHFYLTENKAVTLPSYSFSSPQSKNSSKSSRKNTITVTGNQSKSKNPSNSSSTICFIVASAILFCCLIHLKVFIRSGLFNHFSFVLGSSSILTAVCIWKYKNLKGISHFSITAPFILFLIWALFVFVQSGLAIQYKYSRIGLCFAFLISFLVLRKNNSIAFYKAVAFIATLEGIWCLLQYFEKIPSENLDFNVTGSFANPNVVAIFMALSIPAILFLSFKSKNIILKLFYCLMLILVCFGLVLLECRTAILGGLFSSTVFLVCYFEVFKRFQKKYLFLWVLIIGIVSIPIGKQLYLYKKDSADGRILIWRLTAQMIQDAPLRGYGTGMFEKEYNLKQAKEIQEEKLSSKELEKASFVLMAYNDYLEEAVQGGIPAMLAFLLLFFSFLYPYKKKDNGFLDVEESEENKNINYVAYADIASFALMGLFNFVVSAIPVLVLLGAFAGILCANGSQPKLLQFSIQPNRAKAILLLLTATGIYVSCTQLNEIKTHRKIKKAYDFLATGNIIDAENLLAPLQETQQNSVSYCMIYGNLLFAQQQYKAALYQFNYAKKFSANPSLYEMSARCLLQLKDNKGAIANLQLLTALSPKTMNYKFGLMQVLVADKQMSQARKVAQKMVKMPIINANEFTDRYLKEAKKVLKTQ